MTTEEIRESLIKLGFNLSDRGVYWQTNAVFRSGDNKTAIQIYKDTGVWKDYVQDTCFFPFKKLIEATLGTNDPAQVNSFLGKKSDFDFNNVKSAPPPKISLEETYDPAILERLLPHYDFYNKKNISTNNILPLRGGLATTGQLNQRFVFPIFNQNNKIHGFSGRDMKSGENRPKWKHIGKKKNWIYPLHTDPQTRKAIEESGVVIIVESIGDMLALRESGVFNCLVCFGLSISSKLMCALVSLNPVSIILSLNNDADSGENRGETAAFKNFLNLLSFFDKEKIRICLPTKNDFGEMNSEEILSWRSKLERVMADSQHEAVKIKSLKLLQQKKLSKALGAKIKLL
tara:strand:+ start:8815 stop:9849 length:1035 start_codon:yes stop_codon:yes gene_type:complete